MGFKTDIEIAQETEMLPITDIAAEGRYRRRNIWSSMEITKQKLTTIC